MPQLLLLPLILSFVFFIGMILWASIPHSHSSSETIQPQPRPQSIEQGDEERLLGLYRGTFIPGWGNQS